jgi:hypothetical protein
MPTDLSTPPNKPITPLIPKKLRSNATSKDSKKTYFGLFALITGILSVLSLLSNFTVANLNISPVTFSQFNNLTALFYCVLTPLAFILGVLGHTRKNDSKTLSLIAIVLVTIPFLVKLTQLILYFVK